MLIAKQRGQGMIEIAITALIIASVAIALVKFQVNLVYSNSVSQQQSTALVLINSQIETLRDFTVLTGMNSYDSIASGSSTTTTENAVYTITWTVTPNTTPSYKTISVTATWTDRNGTAQSVTLSTRVAGVDPAFSSSIMG